MELELKLALTSNDCPAITDRLARPECLGRPPERRQHLRNIYFDTPDARLAQARMALRLRAVQTPQGTHWRQTLKTAGQGQSALSERGEWEADVSSGRLEAGPLTATPWKQFDPDGTVWAALSPVFETNFERTLWVLDVPDGSRIELALDCGQIRAQDRSAPITEIELELLSGQPEALFDLAQRLGRQLALLPDPISKAHRGHALAQNRLYAAVPARPPSWPQEQPPATTAQALTGAAFFLFLANVHVLRHQDCMPALEQALEGWTTLRRHLLCFTPWANGIPDDHLGALAPLIDQLQTLQDLHAARHGLVPEFARRTPAYADHWQELSDVLEQQTEGHWSALRQAMATPNCGLALLGLTRWLHDWRERMRSATPS